MDATCWVDKLMTQSVTSPFVCGMDELPLLLPLLAPLKPPDRVWVTVKSMNLAPLNASNSPIRLSRLKPAAFNRSPGGPDEG